MKDLKINVIDAIMGSGKSTAMINAILDKKQDSPSEKFLVIVPYLAEVERYSKKLKGFKQLIKDAPPKHLMLAKHLQEGQDIICTHQLFLQNADLILQYATGYNLVIDEAINSLISIAEFPKLINSNNLKKQISVETDKESKVNLSLNPQAEIYTFTDNDINFLLDRCYIKYDSKNKKHIIWNDEYSQISSIYSCFKDYLSMNDLYCFEKNEELENTTHYYLSFFPLEVFKTFKNIYIMTYLWDAQLMKYYFCFYGAEYHYLYPISVELDKNTKDYKLLDNVLLYRKNEKGSKLRTLKHIHLPGYKLSKIKPSIEKDTNSRTSLYKFFDDNEKNVTLSYSFYNNGLNTDIGKLTVNELKNKVINYIKSNLPKDFRNNTSIIWTVFDCAKKQLQTGCKYIKEKNYIAFNTKATNEYRDANTLIYLVNRHINPFLYNFIKYYCPKGNEFDTNLYALSELIQWIWRSAIRDNNTISIYIPSKRMRNIFIEWLNYYPTSEMIDKNFLSQYTNIDEPENDTQLDNTILIENMENNQEIVVLRKEDEIIEENISEQEEEYKNQCIDTIWKYCFLTTDERDVYITSLIAKLQELHKDYSYRIILFTIKDCKNSLKYIHQKDFDSKFQKISYIFAIIRNNIKTVWEKSEKQRLIKVGLSKRYNDEEIINTLSKKRKTPPTKRRDLSEFIDE